MRLENVLRHPFVRDVAEFLDVQDFVALALEPPETVSLAAVGAVKPGNYAGVAVGLVVAREILYLDDARRVGSKYDLGVEFLPLHFGRLHGALDDVELLFRQRPIVVCRGLDDVPILAAVDLCKSVVPKAIHSRCGGAEDARVLDVRAAQARRENVQHVERRKPHLVKHDAADVVKAARAVQSLV